MKYILPASIIVLTNVRNKRYAMNVPAGQQELETAACGTPIHPTRCASLWNRREDDHN